MVLKANIDMMLIYADDFRFNNTNACWIKTSMFFFFFSLLALSCRCCYYDCLILTLNHIFAIFELVLKSNFKEGTFSYCIPHHLHVPNITDNKISRLCLILCENLINIPMNDICELWISCF